MRQSRFLFPERSEILKVALAVSGFAILAGHALLGDIRLLDGVLIAVTGFGAIEAGIDKTRAGAERQADDATDKT